MLTRRKFLQSSAAAVAIPLHAAPENPKRVAIVTTIYRLLRTGSISATVSSLDTRMPASGINRTPRLFRSTWTRSPMAISAPSARASSDFKVYPTIAEALRCGGDKLAVDAVLIIGEHGNYPRNEKGQILYPRYEFFEQCVKVFEKDGRSVPVYNDKHLSYSFEKAKAMVDASRRLTFPDAGRLFAAGDLASAGYRTAARMRNRRRPDGRVEGGSDPMDFHALEAYAVHGGTARSWRDRRESSAVDRRRRGVEGRAKRAAGRRTADRRAFPQRYAARYRLTIQDEPHAGSGGVRPVAEAGQESRGVLYRVLATGSRPRC